VQIIFASPDFITFLSFSLTLVRKTRKNNRTPGVGNHFFCTGFTSKVENGAGVRDEISPRAHPHGRAYADNLRNRGTEKDMDWSTASPKHRGLSKPLSFPRSRAEYALSRSVGLFSYMFHGIALGATLNLTLSVGERECWRE